MIWTIFYNSGEQLKEIENWHPDKLFKAYQALGYINDKAKKANKPKGGG